MIQEEEGEEGGAGAQRMGEPSSLDPGTAGHAGSEGPAASGRARGGPPAQTSSAI